MSDGKVADWLRRARALGVARLDAQGLLAHALGRDRAWLLAHDDAPLDAAEAERVRTLVERRAAGEPYAYLVGEREFRGLALAVTPAVLIPRPDTETLVEWALELLDRDFATEPRPRVLDLGTGSGAIALALKQARPRCAVAASDASVAALAVARANAARHGLTVEWREGDWWAAWPGAPRWHLVLANPPYVGAGDPHLAALAAEPARALVPAGDNGDGLADIERIVTGAAAHLQPGAWLLLEHGNTQAGAVRDRLAAAGFECVHSRHDLGGHERASGGRRAPAATASAGVTG
ncbi:MAG TPA: peptide chain release factor N(5)-glutamine methyltransferase [Burkholderiaceae bacterium]|nr:peptide chain release factor N(5)-glutamine methyltransferase [Burkholderiaceae bacterium]